MNAAIARAVFQPRSLTIMKKFAMHGMKSVIVTIATTIWIGVDASVAGDVEETGRAEVAPQEPDDEGRGGLARQAQQRP